MKIKLSLFACIIALVFMACDNKDFLYNEGNAFIRIEGEKNLTVDSDSIIFSFAKFPATILEQTITVKASVIGLTADYARELELVVDPTKTTAIQGTHYEFTSVNTIPANASYINIPVVIKRTSELENSSVSLYIKVEDNDDFKAGVNEQNHLKIKWSDSIVKPSNWDAYLSEFFGEYSEVKFRFIIEQTGIGEFTYGNTEGMNWSQMNNYKLIVQAALLSYNEAHPGNVLRDENDNPITFPI